MSDFSEYLFNTFLKWEKIQPKRRSSYSAFARWLSENSLGIEISQPLVSNWVNGKFPPSDKYHYVLIEKLGPEIAQVLDIVPPDKDLVALTNLWKELSSEEHKQLREQAEQFYAQRPKGVSSTDEELSPQSNM